MRTKVYEIPGKVLIEWDSTENIMIAHWLSYAVTLAEYKEAIYNKGLNMVKIHKSKALIIDSSKAKGVFSMEIQNFTKDVVYPAEVKLGLKYFITIDSESALTNMNVKMYSVNADSSGLKTVKASSIKGAIDWLKQEHLY